jgi:hypothetical protein
VRERLHNNMDLVKEDESSLKYMIKGGYILIAEQNTRKKELEKDRH